MHRLAAVARHNAVLFAREPGPAIGRTVMPLVFVSLLRPLYQAAQCSSDPHHPARQCGAAPARTIELVAGKAAPVLALLLAQQVILIGYAVAVLGLRPASYALLALAVLGWAVTLLGLGSAIGTLVRSHSELSVVVDIGSVLLTGLAGALVPLSAMPGWARAVAPASPGYWAMRAISGALGGDTSATLGALGVLLAVAALAAAVAAARVARGWGRSRFL